MKLNLIYFVRPILLMVILLPLLFACSDSTLPDEAIRENIKEIEEAIYSQDNAGVREHLSEFFVGGPQGNVTMDKEKVRTLLAGYFFRYKHIRIVISQMEIEVDEFSGRADMHMQVGLVGAESLLPDSGGIYHVRGVWESEGGDWKLIRLEW